MIIYTKVESIINKTVTPLFRPYSITTFATVISPEEE